MENIKDILDRLCLFYGVSNNRKLSEKININYNTMSTWIKRDSIPYEKLRILVQKESISFDWLLTGKGEMLLKDEKESLNVKGNNNISINGTKNSISNSNNTVTEFPYSSDIQEICALLQEYGSQKFITDLKDKLIQIKKLHE